MYSGVDNQQQRRVRTSLDYDEEVHPSAKNIAQDKLFDTMVSLVDKMDIYINKKT